MDTKATKLPKMNKIAHISVRDNRKIVFTKKSKAFGEGGIYPDTLPALRFSGLICVYNISVSTNRPKLDVL